LEPEVTNVKPRVSIATPNRTAFHEVRCGIQTARASRHKFAAWIKSYPLSKKHCRNDLTHTHQKSKQ
jgi:hypothetical protein